MATFGERFLLGFTSPRSPYLISEYIKVIENNNMDGLPYNVEFQERFYDVLSREKVAGEVAGKAKNKAFAGRDKLTRMPQALGFFIARPNRNFKITEAGKLLKDSSLFEDVLLHQMLKYQLPSPLHREGKSNEGYFRIKPFLELIRLVDRLGYLTYREFTIFGMSFTDYTKFEETVCAIKEYRIKRQEAKSRRESLRLFDYNVHYNLFIELYKDIIDSGNLSTRQTNTETVEEYAKKKISNWMDYADSIFRVLRASGLFVLTKGRSLSISPIRKSEVK